MTKGKITEDISHEEGSPSMGHEQSERFDTIRSLVTEANEAMSSLMEVAQGELKEVDNDSSAQAENLQRVQQWAGNVVQAMTQVSNVARHARSYQAQAHSKESEETPH
jgi:hypothetical protein